jgi:hypothetical protein
MQDFVTEIWMSRELGMASKRSSSWRTGRGWCQWPVQGKAIKKTYPAWLSLPLRTRRELSCSWLPSPQARLCSCTESD